MSKFNSLRVAIDLAESSRDQALALLQKQRNNLAHAQDQMDQLQTYAQETESRWARNAQAGTTPELMHHHYQFMTRLQQAVVLQQDVLSGSTSRLKAAQQQVLQAEIHRASLKLLLAKRQAQQVQHEQRREQKQMDEFASMQTLRQTRQKLESHHGD